MKNTKNDANLYKNEEHKKRNNNSKISKNNIKIKLHSYCHKKDTKKKISKASSKVLRRAEVVGLTVRHPDASESGKTRKYLDRALKQLKELEKIVNLKRASVRQKAAENTISMFRARAQSLIQYLQCGGETSCSSIQEAIFEPVIEYWTSVYVTPEKPEPDLDQTAYDDGDEWA